MTNSGRFTRLFQTFSLKRITLAATVVLTVVLCCVTAYYYFTTPSNAIVVTTTDFPAGLSPNFTLSNFSDQVVSQLQKMIEVADSKDMADTVRLEGLGSRAVKQTLIPIRALSNAPSPAFSLKWKGVDLNFCRSIGTSLRAKKYLELTVIGVPQGGWRLMASLKEQPNFLAQLAGSAPQAGGACSDFEKCAVDLTEQILRSLDSRRLLSFYIRTKTPDANNRILDLYQKIPAPLQADDLVAWGNAFYGLHQYDQALEKYQEALVKDPNSCPALAARGFVYYSRPHQGRQELADLQHAEQDFRKGISCDPRNVFTRTSLCHTLLQEWVKTRNPDAHLLVEAKEHCEKALEIDPQFVRAAVNLGYVLYRQEKHEDALKLFDHLSQRHPTNSALFLNYGFLLYLEYLKNKSEDVLKQATFQTLQSWKLDQNSDIAADNLGYLYYEQGDYPQAVDFWKKASALNTTDPDCIAGLALGTYKLGDPGKAFTLLSSAIQIDSHYGDPAYLRENNNFSERAASDLAELIRLRPR